MRVIEQKLVSAFNSRKNVSVSNSAVIEIEGGVVMVLHGNAIARTNGNKVEISTAGWNTNTTRSRLRALGANIKVRKGVLYKDGKEWDGRWTEL